jgi:uncharacterized protein (UPF0276 family)
MKGASAPLVGFGLDAQHANRYASGLVNLVDHFRARLSHLSIVSLERAEAAREFREGVARGLPIVHHLSGVAPADPDGPNISRLEKLNSITVTLDAVWCVEDIGLWSIGPYAMPYFAPPLFDKDFAREIGARIRAMDSIGARPFLAEVPSCTFAIGNIDLGNFFRLLTDTADCGMVLDVSHVFSYALVTGRDPVETQSSLPLERVREVHVAGGRIDAVHPFRYVDSHSDDILPEVLGLLEHAVRHCAHLEAVTYEIGVGLKIGAIEQGLTRIEHVLANARWVPKISAP